MKSKGKLIPVAPPESQYSLELKQDKNMSSSLVHFDSIEELIDGYNFLCAMNIYFNWIKVEGQPFYEEGGHDDEYLDIQDISETITVSLLAMSLHTPEKPMDEKRLFKALREKGIMDENKPLIPKQEYIEKGYFKLGNSGTKTLITAAGIDFIKQSLGYSDEK